MTSLRRTSLAAREMRAAIEKAKNEERMMRHQDDETGPIIAENITPATTATTPPPAPRRDNERGPPEMAGLRTSTISTVNAPRSREDDKKFWGGKMVDSVQAVEGNISLFSDECLGVHGLYDAFYSRNGWGRTLMYLVTWIGFGVLFLYLTIPLLRDYHDKAVTTFIDFPEFTTRGVPLPIVTVCPHGNGIRCDCLLWRRLYCRYLVERPNKEWRNRFGVYGCPADFNLSSTGEREWMDPQCDTVSPNVTLDDNCRPTTQEIASIPSLANVSGEELYNMVVNREDTGDGPYMAYGEVMLYGTRKVPDQVHFFKKDSSLQEGQLQPVPDHWVEKSYFEESRFQICTQFRAPFEEKIGFAGSRNGITIMVTHIDETLYPINSAAYATAAVDVHINVIEPERYNDQLLPVNRHAFIPLSAGVASQIEYSISSLQRKKGWGPAESRQCQYTKTPRAACVEERVVTQAHDQCDCPERGYREGDEEIAILRTGASTCSATIGTLQNSCVTNVIRSKANISLDECPAQCTSIAAQIRSNYQTKLSESQVEYMKDAIAFSRISKDLVVLDDTIVGNESTIIHVGVSNLFVTLYKDDAKVSIGALLGQIGGNAGLWCGLSFVLMLETLEFLIVALLYGSGFYSGGRKSIRDRVRGWFKCFLSLFRRKQ